MCITNRASYILDTLLFDGKEFVFKDLHAARTFEAYQLVPTPLLLNEVLLVYNRLEKQIIQNHVGPKIIRILFQVKDLKYEFSTLDLQPLASPLKLQVFSRRKCSSGRGLTNYKWDQRDFWTLALSEKNAAADDIISVNDKNNLVETSRCNLFLLKDQIVYTPPLESGCIHGVFRRFALYSKKIELPDLGIFPLVEKNIPYDEIRAYQVFAANSVRGVLSSILAPE